MRGPAALPCLGRAFFLLQNLPYVHWPRQDLRSAARTCPHLEAKGAGLSPGPPGLGVPVEVG